MCPGSGTGSGSGAGSGSLAISCERSSSYKALDSELAPSEVSGSAG